jgi:hypothetical protein
VLPRPGLSASTIVAGLDELIQTAFDYQDPEGQWAVLADKYVTWANGVETALRTWFSDVPPERIYTDRFWRVSMQQSSRLPTMLELEAQVLVEWLMDVRDKVQAMATRFRDPGAIAVLDTNVLLHFKPLDEVPWSDVIEATPVRLVVPLGVVDELDAKKANRGKLGERARTRARLLDQHVFGGGSVRNDVGVEVLEFSDLDPDTQRRSAVPVDIEVLDVCDALKTYTGDTPVYVVTGDLGMKVRARARLRWRLETCVTAIDSH